MGNVWLHCKCIGVRDDIIIVNTQTKNIAILEEQWKQPRLKATTEIKIKPIGNKEVIKR